MLGKAAADLRDLHASHIAENIAGTLRKLAEEIENTKATSRLEDLERQLTVLEEKLFAALLAATPDEEIVAVRAQADRELVPIAAKWPPRKSANCKSNTSTNAFWKNTISRASASFTCDRMNP